MENSAVAATSRHAGLGRRAQSGRSHPGVATALSEIHRVGCIVDLDSHFFEPEQVTGALATAGLEAERLLERDAYPD